ncbi:MAG: nitric oxide reductase activation protein NorD [Thermodesulfobacteriota bacterium]
MEHIVAKGVDKAIQFVHRKRMDGWKGAGDPFVMEGNRRRFSAVASMVAERDVEVTDIRGDTPPRPYWPVLYKMAHPALLAEHGFGWSDGESLFFPVSVVEMPTEKAREELTKLLLFFLSFQIKGGTLEAARQKRSTLEADRLTADLFWIIENTRLFHLIREEYPGIVRDWAVIAGLLLSRRPAKRYLNGPEELVEAFLKESVEGTFSGAAGGDAGGVSGSAGQSLRLADEMNRRWASRGVKTRRYRAMVPFFPWGKLIPGRIKDDAGFPVDLSGPAAEGEQGGSGNEAPAEGKTKRPSRYAARKEEVDEKANENGLALNIYDKILSWAEFVNVPRPFDDDPETDPGAKADECEELSTAELERRTANTFNAELEKADVYTGAEEIAEDPAGESFYYPEWDYKRKVYRRDYSRLVESAVTDEESDFSQRVIREKRRVIREVTRNLELLTPSTRLTGRQFEGDCIDLNAAVDALADLEAGHTPDEKLYARHLKTERDLSVLFLVDLSMSTDGWVGEAKIIEHEKESLIILCEALKKLRDRYAIYGFSGKTRKGCRFFRVKGFSENYGEKVSGRIGGLIPYSYTRMGPALRHATEILKKEKTRSRLLFLLSDGKPNDIDVYEGRYGIEDTRMALKEAEGEGIVPFCLTVDTEGGDYLPRLFGRGNYAVVPDVDMLAKKLPELYARIVHRL